MLQRLRSFFAICLLIFPLLALPPPVSGADATSFDPTTVAVEAKSIGGVPVGFILPWPVGQNPADFQNTDGSYNWLECNGQPINATVYPELFALIGPVVPDLRGLFLRGLGGNSAALGVFQANMVGPHAHHINRSTGGSGNSWIGNGGGGNRGDSTDTWGSNMGAETRPDNKAVRYLLRAK